MKNNLMKGLLLVLCLAPWACKPIFPIGPPVFLATPTPTPNLTPICGFALYNLGTIALNAGPNVIRNQADWQVFESYPGGLINPTPTLTPVIPPPPVNFAHQIDRKS